MYFLNYYNKSVRPLSLIQNQSYNFFDYQNLKSMLVTIQLNTFESDRNLKIVKLFFLMFFLTRQKPFVKKVKFSYIKKQILKKFFFIVNLRKKNFFNFYFYLSHYYFFYFNIYYIKPLKYNFNNLNFMYYIDNIQGQLKNYGKLNMKSQIKLFFNSNCHRKYNYFIKLLNNYKLLNIKKII